MIPEAYTLNKGHVSFFYDKAQYLFARYHALRRELDARGVDYNVDTKLDPDEVFATLVVTHDDSRFNKEYEPTPEALVIIRERIAERIAARPGWYRMRGVIAN